jgi:hypothetical protein
MRSQSAARHSLIIIIASHMIIHYHQLITFSLVLRELTIVDAVAGSQYYYASVLPIGKQATLYSSKTSI